MKYVIGKIREDDLVTLIDEFNSFEKEMDKALVSSVGQEQVHGYKDEFRNNKIYKPNPEKSMHLEAYDILEELIIDTIVSKGIPVTFPVELQYLNYGKGEYFKEHSDDLGITPVINTFRGYTISIALNDNYEGGGLVMFNDDGEEVWLPKEPGSYIIFPSHLRHSAEEVIEGQRKVITAWAHFNWDMRDECYENKHWNHLL